MLQGTKRNCDFRHFLHLFCSLPTTANTRWEKKSLYDSLDIRLKWMASVRERIHSRWHSSARRKKIRSNTTISECKSFVIDSEPTNGVGAWEKRKSGRSGCDGFAVKRKFYKLFELGSEFFFQSVNGPLSVSFWGYITHNQKLIKFTVKIFPTHCVCAVSMGHDIIAYTQIHGQVIKQNELMCHLQMCHITR